MKISPDGETLLEIEDKDTDSDGLFEVPNGIKRIGTNASLNCQSIKTLLIKEPIEINESAFSNCNTLQRIYISNSKIGINAFKNCEGLKHVSIENSTIGSGAFENGLNMESLTLKNCSKIEPYAFEKCANLQKIEMDRCNTGFTSFRNCKNLNRLILKGETTLSYGTFGNSPELHEIFVDNPTLDPESFAPNPPDNLKALFINQREHSLFEKVAASLPETLQSKILPFELTINILDLKKQHTTRLINAFTEPQSHPLFPFFSIAKGKINRTLPTEIFKHLNESRINDPLYQKRIQEGIKEIEELPLPTSLKELDEYASLLRVTSETYIREATKLQKMIAKDSSEEQNQSEQNSPKI
ncbi:MAG: leucine-rich repeat domain-containing protein [Legionella sp.]|nr:leucine-rich repeat domain-containing protein [Legionella sp.]